MKLAKTFSVHSIEIDPRVRFYENNLHEKIKLNIKAKENELPKEK